MRTEVLRDANGKYFWRGLDECGHLISSLHGGFDDQASAINMARAFYPGVALFIADYEEA